MNINISEREIRDLMLDALSRRAGKKITLCDIDTEETKMLFVDVMLLTHHNEFYKVPLT